MGNLNTESIYREISKLTNSEKMVILSKLMVEISPYLGQEEKINIYGIKGIGKEIWKGMDAQEYVNKERSSWE